MTQVVAITGAAGGIGQATAELFSQQGWQVVGIDWHLPENSHSQYDLAIQADVSQPEAWQKIHEQISQRWEQLDGLVNNAAVQICQPLLEMSLSQWEQTMAVNLRSVFLSVRHLHPLLKAVKGAIVNVSSVHAVATSANIGAYAASKGGMLALTRALAIELAPSIRVNAVLPGAVDTPMLREGLQRGHLQGQNLQDLIEQLGSRHLMGRIGQPPEISEAIYFLIDNARSSFLTGQALVVDGGAIACLSTE